MPKEEPNGLLVLGFYTLACMKGTFGVNCTFDFILKIIYNLHANSFTWTNTEASLKQSKYEVRKNIKTLTHIAIDVPDSTGQYYKYKITYS